MQDTIQFLNSHQIPFLTNVDLKQKTWIKRGGIATLWIEPELISDLEKFAIWGQLNGVPFEVIGGTSNTYFLNGYNPSIVISTLKLNKVIHEAHSITCDCGHSMSQLARYCISKGIAGFEGFIGLPGTVAGAAINNSGCFGSLTSDLVTSVEIVSNGNVHRIDKASLDYTHRKSMLKDAPSNSIVVLRVVFEIGSIKSPELLKEKSIKYQSFRKMSQGSGRCTLGSTFSSFDLKPLPLLSNIAYKCIRLLMKLFLRNSIKSDKIKTRLLLFFYHAGPFRKYVSDHWIGCFVWRDSSADDAFTEYVKFIETITTSSKLEIDIKKDKGKSG
jgi:UDP-N-acetylmuramate dehydrogenase